ncbi:phosphonate C-P lyase system protein PhnG [Niveibacterium sp. SC-1]|uniref:phosphonate C-P lyase system protein PhnG n=1 Tax=Niveibacterium sp. SC-1 TaxID=3135646 RepID=UPI00311E1F91
MSRSDISAAPSETAPESASGLASGAVHNQAAEARRHALGVLARASAERVEACMQVFGEAPPFVWLRRPETGTVMLRGRIAGDGAPFNLGETSLTRCTLRTEDGAVGVGLVRGCSKRHAELVALCDALLQGPESAGRVKDLVLRPLAEYEAEQQANRAAEVAASKVDFFTLVRGDA